MNTNIESRARLSRAVTRSKVPPCVMEGEPVSLVVSPDMSYTETIRLSDSQLLVRYYNSDGGLSGFDLLDEVTVPTPVSHPPTGRYAKYYGKLVLGWRGQSGSERPIWVCSDCATPKELKRSGVIPQTEPMTCQVCGRTVWNDQRSGFVSNTRRGRGIPA